MTGNLRFLNPSTMSTPPGYTHVVEITGPGRLVYIAGQLGLDRAGKIVGDPGDFQAQTVQAFENLKSAIEAVGARFEHIVKINNYLVDIGKNIGAFVKCAIATSIRKPRPRARLSAFRRWRWRARFSRSRLSSLCRRADQPSLVILRTWAAT